MKNSACKYEQEVLNSLKTDNWDVETRTHFESCASCQEQARVWNCLHEFSRETAQQAPEMPYGLVWLRSRFLQRQAVQRKALRPVVVFPLLAGLSIGLIGLIWSIWNGSRLQDLIANLTGQFTAETLPVTVTNVSLALSLFLGLLLLITTLSLALSSLGRED